MNKYIYVIALVMAIMIVPFVGAEVITDEVEIRGTVVNGNGFYSYNADSFAGFWYAIDDGLTSETLDVTVTGTRTIAEDDLVYTCIPRVVAYENPDLGDYTILGFMAEKYVAYDNKTDKLVKLLIEWGGSDDGILMVGDVLEMPEGYTLLAQEIDLDGGKCVFALSKDGVELDTEIVADKETYKYLDDEDVMIFSMKVDSVFRGTDTNIVIVKYLFLMSEDILEVDSGDNFGVMEVTGISNGITMKNDDTVTLNEDDEVEIMGDLYFKVADDNLLRYYLAKLISLECPECPTCDDCPECEEVVPCEPCPECPPCPPVNETVVDLPEDPPAVPEPTNTLPGFESVMAICGLLAVAFVVLRQKE